MLTKQIHYFIQYLIFFFKIFLALLKLQLLYIFLIYLGITENYHLLFF